MTETLPIPLTSPLTRAQKASLINLVRRTAKAEILPRFRNLDIGDVSTKSGPLDVVTAADNAAEAMLARGIQQLFPHALVVGEEAISAKPELRDKIDEAELAFILDPLDGTRNFVKGLSLFGVILSITRFGKPVYGLLYDPIMDDFISADQDEPATLTRANGLRQPVKVSDGGALDTLKGYIHFFLLPKDKQAEMGARLPRFANTHALSCSCHEYRTLAQGGADFILSGQLNPWDHAAGALIVERAGGVVRFLDGQDYDAKVRSGYLLAAANETTWTTLAETFGFLSDDTSSAQ